jgi:hypothetical protein
MRTAIALVGLLAASLTSATAATVGAEYCQNDACGNAFIGNTKPDATGFISMMQTYGHSRVFFWGNTNFYPEDNVDVTVPSGLDAWFGDKANITFYSTHGGSSMARFLMTTGVTHVVDGMSTCKSYTSNPTTGKQWWKLGDGELRILNLSTCHGLELAHLSHWDWVSNGLHMICGFDGNESDSPSVGSTYAFLGNIGFTVKQAWFGARPAGNRAVVMAYGVDLADARNRRANERFSWSMARLGPHTWRAWAWIE